MTEAEAKTKWCPMRRITRIGNVHVDNTDGKEFTLNCIGSACMMWRGGGHTVNTGHCGLAGHP